MNKEIGTDLLRRHGIGFESFNKGLHLIVDGGVYGFIDVWPTTWKWRLRKPGSMTRKGLGELITMLRPDPTQKTAPINPADVTIHLHQEQVDMIIEDLIHVANHYEPESPEEHARRKDIIKLLGGDVSLVED